MRNLLVLAFVSSLGCFGPRVSEREAFVDQVRDYHEALRWRRFDDAARQLPPLDRKRFIERIRSIKDEIEISDYEILRSEPKAEDRTQLSVSVEWQSKRSGVLRKTELAETWQRVGKQWLMVGSRAVDGEPMPLIVSEAPTDPPPAQK